MGMEITYGTTPHRELSFHTLFAKISPAASEEIYGQNSRKNKKYQLFWDAKTQLSRPIVTVLKILQIYKIHKGQCLCSAFLLETH